MGRETFPFYSVKIILYSGALALIAVQFSKGIIWFVTKVVSSEIARSKR